MPPAGTAEKLTMAQRIFITRDQLLVSHLYTLLERAGISVLMQKSVVDVPLEETGPLDWCSELWVMRGHQLDRAARLLERALAEESKTTPLPRTEGVSRLMWLPGGISPSSSPVAEIA